MRETEDPLMSAFELRHDPKKMEDVMWETYTPWRGKNGTRDDKEKPAKNRKNKIEK